MADKIKAAADPIDDEVRLTADELDAIKVKARKQVLARRKKELEAAALKAALLEIEGDAGQLTGEPEEDEIVNLTIRVAENATGIVINGKRYEHGVTYPVPRHVARSLMDIMWNTEKVEHGIKGKPLSEMYRQPRFTAISPRGVVNPPPRPDA